MAGWVPLTRTRGDLVAWIGSYYATFPRTSAITQVMNTHHNHRPPWEVDLRLERLRGEDVRVAAKSFSPSPCHGHAPLRLLPVRDLYLPDNSQPAGRPVFFEGRLLEFERQIGVVFVQLDAPTACAASAEGPVLFRGQAAVILRGPAVLELAFPLHIERLPSDSDNYWRDHAGRTRHGGPRLPGDIAAAFRARAWPAGVHRPREDAGVLRDVSGRMAAAALLDGHLRAEDSIMPISA